MSLTFFSACGSSHTEVDRGVRKADAKPSTDREGELADIVGWTCDESDPRRYGVRTMTLDAQSFGMSTGLWLEAGETATIESEGSWTNWVGQTTPFGPNGHADLTPISGCKKGALAARVGLSEIEEFHCVGRKNTITARRSGIVYLAMNDNSSPLYHGGSLNITIESSGSRILSIPTRTVEVANRDICGGGAPWMELVGDHVALDVPAALAEQHKSSAGAAVDLFDAAYDAMSSLMGGLQPYGGQRIRMAPDFEVRDQGWILAANPILYDPLILNAQESGDPSILQSADEDVASFELVRSMAVGFSRAKGDNYIANQHASQGFAGILTLYAMEQLDRPYDLPRVVCYMDEEHQQSGGFSDFTSDGWLQMCLWQKVAERYGWASIARFFSGLPEGDEWESVLPSGSTATQIWEYIAEEMVDATQDPSAAALLRSFHLPI